MSVEGQAAQDEQLMQYSACTQVRVSRHLDTSTTAQVAQHHGPTLKNRLFLLERHVFGHPLASLLWRGEDTSKKVLLENGWEEVRMLFCAPPAKSIPVSARG